MGRQKALDGLRDDGVLNAVALEGAGERNGMRPEARLARHFLPINEQVESLVSVVPDELDRMPFVSTDVAVSRDSHQRLLAQRL